MAEEAKKKEPSVPFNPYRILQSKYRDLQFGNKYTKAFLRSHRSSTSELSYLHTHTAGCSKCGTLVYIAFKEGIELIT